MKKFENTELCLSATTKEFWLGPPTHVVLVLFDTYLLADRDEYFYWNANFGHN